VCLAVSLGHPLLARRRKEQLQQRERGVPHNEVAPVEGVCV